MRNLYVLLFLILISVNLFGQGDTWKYINQTAPQKTAQLFAPELIEHLAHSSPSFTPDGKEIYWSTVSGENETRKIYFVKFENGAWSEKKVVSFSGQFHDDQPFISYDGKTMYFASKRTPKDDGTFGLDIWISDREGENWGEPKQIENNIGFWTPSVTLSGTIYFLDNINGKVGICRSVYKDGEYSKSNFLPETINLEGTRNCCPFIAPDESYLIFSSNRPGGMDKYGDLYISFKEDNDEWGEAINMGESVNTDKQERFPGVSPDGKYLFFTRWYDKPYYHDLYWIDAGIIKDLRRSKNGN